MIAIRIVLLATLLVPASVAQAEMQQDWVVHWDGFGYDDHGLEVVADGSGDVYVMGRTYNGSDYDYVVLKYDGDSHTLIWERVYDRGDGDDVARDITVSGGWVYVVGESFNGSDLDFLMLRLSAADGSVDWVKIYDGGRGDDEAYAVAVGGLQVYVTGESRGLLNDNVRTICYNVLTGSQSWSQEYNGGLNDYATAIAIDDAGYVYVVGGTAGVATGMNFLTILYNSAGTELWVKVKDGSGSIENDPDLAWDVAVYDDDVYVTGQLNGAFSALDYGTISYRRSDGHERWLRTHDGAASGNDKARAITIGSDGSVWVTGTSLQSSAWGQSCVVTIQYDLSGTEVCDEIHCSGMSYVAEEGRDIDTDASGNAWVAGRLMNPSYDYDFSLTQINGDCDRLWAETYDRNGDHDDAYGVSVDDDAIYVTGEGQQGSDLDVTLVRYVDAPAVELIEIVEPSGGEHWHVGTTHDIIWTSQGIADVAIEYTTDWGAPSPTWHPVVPSTPSDGIHTWEIPLIPDEPSDDCRLRISDAADGDPSDVSDESFEIYRFLVTRDGFGFDDDSHHSGPDDQIWPDECWVDYSAYPYTDWEHFDWEIMTEVLVDMWALLFEGPGGPAAWPAGSAFPSWPMFVDAFGESKCYFDPPPNEVVFKPSAVYYWMYGLPKMHFGSCFGFAAISCLIFDDLTPLGSMFPGYDHLYDVPLGDCSPESAKMMTNRYIATMYGAQHRAYNASHVLSTGPTETLNDVKAMLANEERDHRPICLWATGMAMSHFDVPLRVESHPTDPDIEYIYVYENFYAGADTFRFEIDTSADTWTYQAPGFNPDTWSGHGRRLYLTDETSTFLDPPLLPNEYIDEVQITSSPGAYGSFHPLGRGLADTVHVYMSQSSLSFEDQPWGCEFDSLQTGSFNWGIFTDSGSALCYARGDAEENDHEEMRYAGDGCTATVCNPAAGTRTHTLTGVDIHASDETLCAVEGISVTPGDSIRYQVREDGGLRVDNFGDATTYGLRAAIVDASGWELFYHGPIDIAGMTRHAISLNWLTHEGDLSIDIDYGIDGSIEETIWVGNQWAAVDEQEGSLTPASLAARTSPNPFRSRTTIEYYLPVATTVRVEVFTPDARRAATLVDMPETAGWHRVLWEPGELPSGVYFVRIVAGEFEERRKISYTR